MPNLRIVLPNTLAGILMLTSVACGANSSHPVQAASNQPARASTESAAINLTVDDLTAYEKGLAQEIAQVQSARERGNNAKTPSARAATAQDEWEEQTIPGGARAAGLSVERYRNIRKTVNHVLETLNFQRKIQGPLELDLEHATPEMKQRLNVDPFAELSLASASALRTRMNSLVPIWIRYMNLVAVNG